MLGLNFGLPVPIRSVALGFISGFSLSSIYVGFSLLRFSFRIAVLSSLCKFRMIMNFIFIILIMIPKTKISNRKINK